MAFKCGIDLVDVERIKKSIESEHSAIFLKRVFTEEEIEYCNKNGRADFQSYAARFAAKEAFSKAMGTGIGVDVILNEVGVRNVADGRYKGRPELVLSGRTATFFEECGGKSIEISLSHTDSIAQAVCIIEFA